MNTPGPPDRVDCTRLRREGGLQRVIYRAGWIALRSRSLLRRYAHGRFEGADRLPVLLVDGLVAASRTPTNSASARKMFAAIEQAQPRGVRYASC